MGIDIRTIIERLSVYTVILWIRYVGIKMQSNVMFSCVLRTRHVSHDMIEYDVAMICGMLYMI